MGCHNNLEHEHSRRAAIEMVLDRNPHGFRPKIVAAAMVVSSAEEGAAAEESTSSTKLLTATR